MIARLRYIQKFRDRHNHVRLYFRRKGKKPIALPAQNHPEFLAAYQAALTSTAAQPPVSRVREGSFEALCRSYYGSADFKQLNRSTQVIYRGSINTLCKKYGTLPVRLLTTEHVRKMMDAGAETPSAMNHKLGRLRTLMQHAIRLGLIHSDPTIGVKRLKEVKEGAETWTEGDIAAYETRWPLGSRQRLAMNLLLYLGQRRSDMVKMGWKHVTNDVIEVRTDKSSGKTKLHIPLHPELAECLALEPVGNPTFLMTVVRGSKPYTPFGFYRSFKTWCAAAGLPADRSPHGLRKAACRRLAEAGCSVHEIAAITGHKNLKEIELYTRAADQKRLAQTAVTKIGRPMARGLLKNIVPRIVQTAG